jgi:hypothetical protein
MRRRGLSARLERRLERGDHVMELNRLAFERLMEALNRFEAAFNRHEKAFDRHEKSFERMMAAFDRSEQRFAGFEERLDRFEARMDERHEESKLFMRESNLRLERVVRELVKQNARFGAEQEKRTEEIVAEMRESREESKAGRLAILALLDRLPPAAAA